MANGRLRRVLDRVWLWAVGIAFVVMVPIWLIEWTQDYGVWRVGLVIGLLFLLGFIRGWPVTAPPPP